MDQLSFDPANSTNTDTTMEVEGYEDQVEEIQQAYPEEDWRTPVQIEEENQAQVEQQAPSEGVPEQPTAEATTEVVSDEPEPFDWGKPNEQYNQSFIAMKNSEDEYGYVALSLIHI